MKLEIVSDVPKYSEFSLHFKNGTTVKVLIRGLKGSAEVIGDEPNLESIKQVLEELYKFKVKAYEGKVEEPEDKEEENSETEIDENTENQTGQIAENEPLAESGSKDAQVEDDQNYDGEESSAVGSDGSEVVENTTITPEQEESPSEEKEPVVEEKSSGKRGRRK